MSNDEAWMRRAIELARKGAGRTRPNPHVGCVVVRDGAVIAEGWHRKAGDVHAEVDALRKTDDAQGATAYVNLEPCSHHGRTPPCVDALVNARVSRVVVAMIDPDPRVSGRGIEHLRAHGIEVEVGVLEEEARYLNRGYLKLQRTQTPWVLAKWAMTLDGRISSTTGHSAWVTGEESRGLVHELRDELDAILVGAGTVRLDDPQLTCRREGGRNPTRVILDSLLSLEPTRRVFDSNADVLVYASVNAPEQAEHLLKARGVKVVRVPRLAGGLDLQAILQDLGKRGIMSMLVEGGGAVHGSFFDAKLVDEVFAFVSPKIIGGELAPGPVGGLGIPRMDQSLKLSKVQSRTLGEDFLIQGLPVYEER
ncbi:bifunctional diaminohydroxyphosphoribosylaminopyrimidine deaminase/5-amino-6-(5-phosphoribosylamino)uracil reductase RibD [Microvenator marinus]|nr:bifunctional diaminohydroxyphosphoribosylaminopyrimidine deaminase/5-amino-6-(5-phosphoribosylamino)uracil reductase RibD [Microvenator marinus]